MHPSPHLSKRLSKTRYVWPGSYWITSFALVPSICETLGLLCKSEVSFPSVLWISQYYKSHWPSKPDTLGAPFPGSEIPRLGSTTWALEPSLVWGKYCIIIIIQFVHCPPGAWDLIISWVCFPSYLSCFHSFFMSLFMEDLFLHRFWFSPVMVILQKLVILVCSWEEVNSGSFYLHLCQSLQRKLLYFHTNLEIICSSSVKNVSGSLIGIALNL